jgi:RNA polymerase sigma-70 factor, ECF subfamily
MTMPQSAMPAPLPSRQAGAPVDADADLLDRLLGGDDDAYAELVRTHGGRMLAVARRLLRDQRDAEDAVQDAFISAFRALPRFSRESRLSTWLHRIVVNASLMKLRSAKRRPEVEIETLLPAFQEDGHHVEQYSEWLLPADVLMVREEGRATVRAAIDLLPAGYRTVLLLRDIEQLDNSDIAAVLGITPNAVKIRVHRARQALRTLLDPMMRGGVGPQHPAARVPRVPQRHA